MNFGRFTRWALLASTLCSSTLWPAGTSLAVSFLEFVDPNPAPGNQFGATVVALSTGNVVITSPMDDAGGTDAGAVYLFNGSTGALISTLRGSTASDFVGNGGVTALSNGNYVVRSANWDNGAAVDAGAVTWGSGTTGVSGVVSAANSLVGSTSGNAVGLSGVDGAHERQLCGPERVLGQRRARQRGRGDLGQQRVRGERSGLRRQQPGRLHRQR